MPKSEPDLVLRFDGCAAPTNPGPASYAVVVESPDGTELRSFSVAFGHATNNEAEWRGLIAALKHATELGARRACVLGDSKLVVEQANRRWRVKKPHLQPLAQQAWALMENFDSLSIEWVRRDNNERADFLAGLALEGASPM